MTSSNDSYCNHCRRQSHIESKCWTKFPNLNPRNKNNSESEPGFFANTGDVDCVVSLTIKYENTNQPKNLAKRFVDSGCNNHMTQCKCLILSHIESSHFLSRPTTIFSFFLSFSFFSFFIYNFSFFLFNFLLYFLTFFSLVLIITELLLHAKNASSERANISSVSFTYTANAPRSGTAEL